MQRKFRARLQSSAPAAIVASLSLIFLTFYLSVRPYAFQWDDNLFQFTPWYEFDYLNLSQGIIPQINYYQYLGQTYLSNAQNGAFYPPVFLSMSLWHALGAPEWGITWLCMIHLIAATLVLERMARYWSGDIKHSILCSLIYLTFPVVLGSAQFWVVVAYALFYIPLVFWQLERCLEKITSTRVIQLALIKGLFLLSGHINYFALSLIFEGLYLLLRAKEFQTGMRILLVWFSGNIGGVLLALPSLGPIVQHLSRSAERSLPYGFEKMTEFHVDPVTFLVAQMGIFLDHAYIFQAAWNFLGGFLLIFPILLLGSRVHHQARLFLVCLAVAWVLCTPLFWIFHEVPFYKSFRWPGKNLLFVVLFYVLCLSLLGRILPARPRLAWGLLLFALFTNILVIILPSSRSKAELYPHYALNFHLPLEQLRQARTQVLTVTYSSQMDPNFLTYDFATLAQVPVFNGYDALVDRQNKQEALNTVYLGLLWNPLDNLTLSHLRSWSVRYYVQHQVVTMPPAIEGTTSWRKIYSSDNVVVYEDPEAESFVHFMDNSQSLPFQIHGNDFSFMANGGTGMVSIALVPLAGYVYRCGSSGDWKNVPAKDSGRMQLLVDMPGQITLRYQEPGLMLYMMISAGTLLLAGAYLAYKTIQRSQRL